jgi:hypothetical protein
LLWISTNTCFGPTAAAAAFGAAELDAKLAVFELPVFELPVFVANTPEPVPPADVPLPAEASRSTITMPKYAGFAASP